MLVKGYKLDGHSYSQEGKIISCSSWLGYSHGKCYCNTSADVKKQQKT